MVKPGHVTSLTAIYGILPYVGWDCISECCGWNSIVGPLLGAPFIAHSAAIKARAHGGIQYFSSAFTTNVCMIWMGYITS